MAFQFYCPQGHLLQGDDSLVGQQCQCPFCGTLLVVPADPAGHPAQGPGPATDQPMGGYVPQETGTPPAAESEMPAAETAAAPAEQDGAGPAGAEAVPAAPAGLGLPSIVHIPCPRGHLLETPSEMVGEDAICPFCGTQFHLGYENSLEHKQLKAEEQQRREQRVSRLWLAWSIAAAVLVLGAVVALIVLASSAH